MATRVNDADLTTSERVYLWRKRRHLTQPLAAAFVGQGTTTEEWRAWEAGQVLNGKSAPANVLRGVSVSGIRPWEWLGIWRRRKGWTVTGAARRQGLSHVTLIARERGQGEWEKSVRWWEEEEEVP